MKSVEYYLEEAEKFINDYYKETGLSGLISRLNSVKSEIELTGIWHPTTDELSYGGRVAWRNSNRCIGRLFYSTLKVLDFRELKTEEEIFHAIVHHLKTATNKGKIVSTLSVFRADDHGEKIRIWNGKLVRYAGYEKNGEIVGDPDEVEFTKQCIKLGWKGKGTPFDILPVVIQIGNSEPKLFELPLNAVLEVQIEHPEYPWFDELNLRWYAVPVITDMVFKMGGLHFSAAPFNGWFMETEIGSRNFGDQKRYNLLPVLANKMDLDIRSKINLWKDRVLIELNKAVLYSFRKAGVTITDHHTASKQFMRFCKIEDKAGRKVMADWTWIVPPLGASSVEVFHNEWPNDVKDPNFYYQNPPWAINGNKTVGSCPFHIKNTKIFSVD